MINSHAASSDRGTDIHAGPAAPSQSRLLPRISGLVGLVMLAVFAPAAVGADGWFVDVTESSGLDFHHDNGANGKYYFPEIMGGGVALFDYNGSGLEDIFITHMRTETNTLYVNIGQGWFEDRTARFGLGTPSLSYTGFGTAWLDIDNDGWLDLVAVNGAVMKERHLLAEDDPFPYHQRNQIFANRPGADGSRRFAEVTDQAGTAFEASLVSRGAAFGDLNNNGRVDMVIANNNGPARVLVNSLTNGHHWLGLRLLDADGRRDQTGAVVYLLDVDDPGNDAEPIMRRSRSDGSYASANDPRVLFGLGEQSAKRTVRVRWPDQSVEEFSGLDVDRYHELRAGSGRPPASDTEDQTP